MDDIEFRDLVEADVHGNAGEEAAYLRDPEVLRRWHTTLMHIVADLEGQLGSERAQDMNDREYESWRGSLARVRRRVEAKLSEASELLRSQPAPAERVKLLEAVVEAARAKVIDRVGDTPMSKVRIEDDPLLDRMAYTLARLDGYDRRSKPKAD